MTSCSPLEVLRLEIVKVSARIDEVDQELTTAKQPGLAATDSFLRDTLLELRKEKNELRAEKNELRAEKNELRKHETILLQANAPGQCDASYRPVFHLCRDHTVCHFLKGHMSLESILAGTTFLVVSCGTWRCQWSFV